MQKTGSGDEALPHGALADGAPPFLSFTHDSHTPQLKP